MAALDTKDKNTVTQVVTPMIAYENAAAAMDWLCRAFGFTERMRMTDAAGKVTHAELELNGGVIMLAQPTPDYRSPSRHAEECEQARRWLSVPFVIDGAHVFVDDVDAHFRRARDEGATILSEPEDQPYAERTYRVADLEGHRWMFAQTL
jgi:PhnB protein